MFSVGPPRDYMSGTERNEASRTTENEDEKGAYPSDVRSWQIRGIATVYCE